MRFKSWVQCWMIMERCYARQQFVRGGFFSGGPLDNSFTRVARTISEWSQCSMRSVSSCDGEWQWCYSFNYVEWEGDGSYFPCLCLFSRIPHFHKCDLIQSLTEKLWTISIYWSHIIRKDSCMSCLSDKKREKYIFWFFFLWYFEWFLCNISWEIIQLGD
jgi:hypothetical protein